jgi:uncharacterized protein YuzE
MLVSNSKNDDMNEKVLIDVDEDVSIACVAGSQDPRLGL